MNKKEFLIPFVFIGLSGAFLFICAMVYFSDGKSKKLIARKMKIGGLLLSLSYFSCNNQVEYIGCYDIIPEPTSFEINLDSSNILHGSIGQRKNKEYSFAIININGTAVQKEYLLPKDCEFDTEYEDFVIWVDKMLDTGKYQLKLYNCKPENQEHAQLIKKYELIISKN